MNLEPIKVRLDGVSREMSLGDPEFIDILALEAGDAEFLKHAVYDVAILVDEVEQLLAKVADLERERDQDEKLERAIWDACHAVRTDRDITGFEVRLKRSMEEVIDG
jgi:hypothetical protein